MANPFLENLSPTPNKETIEKYNSSFVTRLFLPNLETKCVFKMAKRETEHSPLDSIIGYNPRKGTFYIKIDVGDTTGKPDFVYGNGFAQNPRIELLLAKITTMSVKRDGHARNPDKVDMNPQWMYWFKKINPNYDIIRYEALRARITDPAKIEAMRQEFNLQDAVINANIEQYMKDNNLEM